MKKKKEIISQNYLEKIPVRPEHIEWSSDETGIITLDIKNTGLFNRIAQKLFRKPKVSHIHLDEMGSFVWPLLDGDRNIKVRTGDRIEIQKADEKTKLIKLSKVSFLETLRKKMKGN